MRQPPSSHTAAGRKMMRAIGFFLSALGAWCQIFLLATVSLTPPYEAGDPLAGVPICHVGADGTTDPGRHQPVHHTHDCALCAICFAHASPLAIVSAAASLPAPGPVISVGFSAAYPRAPPVHQVEAAQPRGPPVLI